MCCKFGYDYFYKLYYTNTCDFLFHHIIIFSLLQILAQLGHFSINVQLQPSLSDSLDTVFATAAFYLSLSCKALSSPANLIINI